MNVPWTLEELLPHRPPMLLIDAVEEFDSEAKSLTARVTVAPGQIFFVAGPDGAGGGGEVCDGLHQLPVKFVPFAHGASPPSSCRSRWRSR